jgi:hypothetical protein
VTTVFTNVVGRAPTASEQGLYVELLVGVDFHTELTHFG